MITKSMGYRHTENLYKNQKVMLFKEGYATEKVHGTSAHVSFKRNATDPSLSELKLFSGGEPYARFAALWNLDELKQRFIEKGFEEIVVFGEAYGGSQQGMSHTYGPKLCFIVFEVKIGDRWLDVETADRVATSLGFEFVPYKRIPMTIEAIDAERDADSEVAIRRGMGPGKKREGVVLRPLVEVTLNNDERIIAKHKREDFQEHKSPRPVLPDGEKQKLLEEADKIAEEWVVPMRLEHVLDKLPKPHAMEQVKEVIAAMISDVYREAKGEIVESKATEKAIGKKTVELFKKKLAEALNAN